MVSVDLELLSAFVVTIVVCDEVFEIAVLSTDSIFCVVFMDGEDVNAVVESVCAVVSSDVAVFVVMVVVFSFTVVFAVSIVLNAIINC